MAGIRSGIPKSTRYKRDKDREMVKGVFNYHERQGGVLPFFFKKYLGEPVQEFTFYDGEVCTIPLGVAKHLNSSGQYTIHEHAIDENGKSITKLGIPRKRYSFQSLEFTNFHDVDNTGDDNTNVDNTNVEEKKIITVEKV